jgi:hypothetical protein
MKSAQLPVDPATVRTRIEANPRPIYPAIIAVIVVTGMAVIAMGYWPGVMIDDARWQYQQSVDNAYEDWHPPLMAWIWHQFIPLEPGPAPMLLLQLSLFWVGIASIAYWLYRRGNPRLGVLAAFVGWIPAPLALLGSVTKDCLMAAVLSSAVGLLLWREEARTNVVRAMLGVVIFAMLLLAAALRVNAFLACVPLGLAALPRSVTRTIPRFTLAALACTAIFFVTPPLVASALHAEDTDAQLSLIIFDLGGITEYSGSDQFPDLKAAEPVRVNRQCYDPVGWDSYSTWAKKACPIGFEPFQALVDEGDTDPRMLWFKAVTSHPIAYAEHRLAHFNLSTWFLVRGNPVPTAWTQSVANPWNFQVRPNAVLRSVDVFANGAAMSPLGWPIFWIALALAVLMAATAAKLTSNVKAVASSAFLYGIGYLVFGVATGMRYYVWTIVGAALAAILAADGLARAPRMNRREIALFSAVVVIPTTMAAVARLAA